MTSLFIKPAIPLSRPACLLATWFGSGLARKAPGTWGSLAALACGLPLLATQHADIPYIVAEGESALLAPERDVDALFKNLLVLLEEPERWAPMGAAGRVRVEHLHDALVEVPRLEQLYLELAKEAPCSPS